MRLRFPQTVWNGFVISNTSSSACEWNSRFPELRFLNFRSIQSFNEFGSPNRTLCFPSETYPRGKEWIPYISSSWHLPRLSTWIRSCPALWQTRNLRQSSVATFYPDITPFTYRNPELKQPIVKMLMIWPLDAIYHCKARINSQQDMNFYFLSFNTQTPWLVS